MRILIAAVAVIVVMDGTGVTREGALPIATPNDNRGTAGSMRDGAMTVTLEARRVVWYPNGDSLPGRETTAFAEAGKAPSIPGPLLRVRAGTEVRLVVRNIDVPDTLRFGVQRRAIGFPSDSVVIAPGGERELRFTPMVTGNFYYLAEGADTLSRQMGMNGLLGGAFIVDSAGARAPNDRVLVLNWSIDALDTLKQLNFDRTIFTINGKSWPHTERLSATVGDTVRWRVVNLNADVHPIHLHGFYFRVDDYMSIGAPVGGQERMGRMVVTERMPAFSRMSMTWIPERAGNWLAHCHFAVHLLTQKLLESPSLAKLAQQGTEHAGGASAHANHALTGMAGLVMGVNVRPRPGERIAEPARGRRQLRLVTVQDDGFSDTLPSLRFRLEEPGRAPADAGTGFSPAIVLRRNEPVSITVVNTLREPTAVHWHGIELESYFDGVAGFGGTAGRLSPIIAPRDSFEARFTPPRAGTFIYHSHVNEIRQHAAGMLGALVVVDSARVLPANDYVFLLKAARSSPVGGELEVNGRVNPDTVTLRAGQPARLRFISLTAVNPNATVWLTARADSVPVNQPDSLVAQWRPVAKDGADLPPEARQPRQARQLIAMGETYDFEFTPPVRGRWRIEIRTGGAAGVLLVRIPIRVE